MSSSSIRPLEAKALTNWRPNVPTVPKTKTEPYYYYRKAENLLDQFIDDPRGCRLARDSLNNSPPSERDSFWHHLMGLTYYLDRNNDPHDQEESLVWFQRAWNLDPTHHWPNLYLGYVHFDQGQWNQALSHFQVVDDEFFIKQDKAWRVVKNQELILCCQLYLAQRSSPAFGQLIHSLSSLLRAYQSWPNEDELPVPLEICVATGKLNQTHTEGHWREWLALVAQLIATQDKVIATKLIHLLSP